MAKNWEIKARRNDVRKLTYKGYDQEEIAKTLNCNRQTIASDIKAIKEEARKRLYELAGGDINRMYYDRMDSMLELHRRSWAKLEEPGISEYMYAKMSNLILRSNEVLFNMVTNGPGVMELNRLQNDVKKLKYNAMKDMNLKSGGVGMFAKQPYHQQMTDQELEDAGVANLKARDDEYSLIEEMEAEDRSNSILNEENPNSPLYHHSHDMIDGRHYEEGEVVFKEDGSSPYVYHSSEYLHKSKLGILGEEEKRRAEETTKQCWKRYHEQKEKEKEQERLNKRWDDIR